ncbi:MAG: 30S ribosomal protein S16 [Candidatus Pacebacteria bacterium]|nr:30S ribosomal protein S16 [Candidatus Paceibacterota bacterium]
MLSIRLLRTGKKNQPFYRMVVTDKKNPPRGGRFLEIVGFLNPFSKEKQIKADRIKHWLSVGAKPSDTVHNMLVKEKVIEGEKIAMHKEPKKKAIEAKAKASADAKAMADKEAEKVATSAEATASQSQPAPASEESKPAKEDVAKEVASETPVEPEAEFEPKEATPAPGVAQPEPTSSLEDKPGEAEKSE